MQKMMQVLAASVLALSPASAFGSTIDLADITITDELGYECIAGEYFEEVDDNASLAFSVGKKVRLPRTCLPEPCEAALTPRELSQITGTEVILPRFQEEWNEYYARYADYCRKETTDFLVADADPGLPKQFWTPFQPDLTTSDPSGPIARFEWPVASPVIVSTRGTPTPPIVPTTIVISDPDDPPSEDERAFTGISPTPPFPSDPPDDNPPPGEEPPGGTPIDPTRGTPPPPTPVPLPASWVLLLGSLGLMARIGSRRSA